MSTFVNMFKKIKKHKQLLLLIIALGITSFIYSTHLSSILIPKGYDLLFHLGNVFALQIKFGFDHNSLASFGISPLIFNDFGYGTHLFYPPLAHFIPALISLFLSKIGINSTLLAIRLFSFLTIFSSGATMFYAAKKITKHSIYAFFASLLYLSAPYLHMDYYWRGGMSSSLCFVFLPILLLSFYYFIKEKFTPYFFTLIISMTLLTWTHVATAFYSFILFSLFFVVNFFFTKKKKAALFSTIIAGLIIGILTAPFWSLLLQQYVLKSHVIFGSSYPFTIFDVAHNTLKFHSLFDIQFAVWEFKIRSLTAIFNIVILGFFITTVLLFQKIKKRLKSPRFLYTLVGLFTALMIMVTTKALWYKLPDYFAFIQYPHRLLLLVTPVLSLFIALPTILIRKITRKKLITLGILSVFIISYTFVFNNFELYELGKIDYTTHSIIQAMGVEREYLPSNTKANLEILEERSYQVLPLTNSESPSPSATIIKNETPYMLVKIENNDSKETIFELPRLFYAGYELKWKTEGENETSILPYDQSEHGLITTTVIGNGKLEVQYIGGQWYPLLVTGSVIVFGYLSLIMYRYYTKRNLWFEKL